MSDPTSWRPTARLRWVDRCRPLPGASMPGSRIGERILQQFWGPEAPSYMRDDSIGEWRDVPFGVEAP